MRFNKKNKAVALVALAASAALLLSSCASDSGTGNSGDEGDSGAAGASVTFLPKNLGNPYFDTSSKGGKAAVEEFGGTFNEVGPAEATPDAQVSFINTATQQGVDALAVSANEAHRNPECRWGLNPPASSSDLAM